MAFMYSSDWCLEVENRFGYNFYKGRGFCSGVGEEGRGGEGVITGRISDQHFTMNSLALSHIKMI